MVVLLVIFIIVVGLVFGNRSSLLSLLIGSGHCSHRRPSLLLLLLLLLLVFVVGNHLVTGDSLEHCKNRKQWGWELKDAWNARFQLKLLSVRHLCLGLGREVGLSVGQSIQLTCQTGNCHPIWLVGRCCHLLGRLVGHCLFCRQHSQKAMAGIQFYELEHILALVPKNVKCMSYGSISHCQLVGPASTFSRYLSQKIR